jgi:hypothetical protein
MPVTYDLLSIRGDLLPLKPPRFVLDTVDGLGMNPVRHITQANAQQDGITYIDTRLVPRVVTFGGNVHTTCELDTWAARDDLNAALQEFYNGFILRGTRPDGQRRLLDLRYDSGLSWPHDLHLAGHVLRLAWQAVAMTNPTWYDANGPVLISYNLGAMLGQGFPWGFPHSFGTDILTALSPIVYPGTWKTYPIIRITGPADDIVITNTTTGEKLDMTGRVLLAGETIVIDMTPGMKTITHSVYGPIMYWLTSDSDIGTFHFAAHPDAMGGINTVTVVFTGGMSTSTVQISYTVRYLSL